LPAPREQLEAGRRWLSGELGRRVASGVVLAAAAIAVAVYGGLPFLLFWTAAALWVLWEWVRIVGSEPRGLAFGAGAVALAIAAGLLAYDAPAVAALCALIGVAVVASTSGAQRAWSGGGVLYAFAILLPPVMLRGDDDYGLIAVLWLFAVVWASDIAAYFCGRFFGGPRLAPAISPNKTWSGTIGGLVAGTAAGLAVLAAAGVPLRGPHLAVLLVAAVSAQIGDLAESAMKRRFGVKDASQLVPGHGGLMDRLDGFLAAGIVALAIGWIRGGGATPATGLLAW
jgi:phosphatidate cytidylyltransferase